MTDEIEDKTFCPGCLATDVSFNVVNVFSDLRPKVKMSYNDWMLLQHIIETEIKEALGVPVEEVEDGAKPTVQ